MARIMAKKRETNSRARDFLILTGGSVAVLVLIFFTGAIGIVEAITSSLVIISGALAFYVGSEPAPKTEPETLVPQNMETREDAFRRTINALITAFPFPALLINAAGRISAANTAAADILQQSDIQNALASKLIRQPDLMAASVQVAKTKAAECVEFSGRAENEVWLANILPGPFEGSVLILFEELSAVLKAQQARADFLAFASHELRTPLTSIRGFIETMQGPAKDDYSAWNGFLNIMKQEAARMQRLIDDLLSLSRIEFSEHTPPSERHIVNTLVSQSVLTLQPTAAADNITLQLSMPDEPIEAVIDADEITLIVQNLVSNAIKYAHADETVTISLNIAKTMQDAEQKASSVKKSAHRALLLAPRASREAPAFYLRVEDTGQGIAANHLPRLSERFYRADESRGGAIKGTGLGLAIVKHIMARHRGGFAVESREGDGAAFGIWMPRLTK